MAQSHSRQEPSVKLSFFLVVVVAASVLSSVVTLKVYQARHVGTQAYEEKQSVPENTQSLQPQTQPGPQVFSGVLPCADCSGLKTELTLQKNSDDPSEGVYTVKQVYEGKTTQPLTTLGKWDLVRGSSRDSGAIIIKLKPSSGEDTQYWQVVDNDTLQMLDAQEQVIKSPFNLLLKRAK